MRNRWACLVVAALAVIPMSGHARGQMFEPERVGRWHLSGAGGSFNEETDSQIFNYSGQFGLAVGAGFRLKPHLGLEIDGLFASQRVDEDSVLRFAGERANLYGFGGLVKLILPLNRVELYVGGGVGLYSTTLWSDVGFQGVAGLDLFVSRNVSVGLEYRRLKLDAFLGALVPGFDLGGDFLFATVRGHF